MQDERIIPLVSSATQYTMSNHEENIVRLLRSALQEEPAQDAGGIYMRRIRDLDPPNMVSVNQEGHARANTFFDICCKVWCRSSHTSCPVREASCNPQADVSLICVHDAPPT